MQEIILASRSPRRRQLMEALGIKITCYSADIEEKFEVNKTPWQNARYMAQQKALATANLLESGLIIAADTIVICNGQVMGKPDCAQDAYAKLALLNGNSHEVITGLCLYNKATGNFDLHHEITKVYFRNYSEEEIWAYIATGEPMDKAGAYGIQGLGAIFVKKIEGCYFNVVGLPLSSLYIMLKKQGVDLLGGGVPG